MIWCGDFYNMKKIVNFVNDSIIIINVINLVIMLYIGVFEYIKSEYVFYFMLLPIKYIIFVGRTSFYSFIYSIILIIYMLGCSIKRIQLKTVVVLHISSLCSFIIYMIHIINTF